MEEVAAVIRSLKFSVQDTQRYVTACDREGLDTLGAVACADGEMCAAVGFKPIHRRKQAPALRNHNGIVAQSPRNRRGVFKATAGV
jgi:hypothetical protein